MNGPKHSLPESLAHQQGEGKDAESPTSLHRDTEVLRRLVNPKTRSEQGSAEHVDSDSQSPPVGVVGGGSGHFRHRRSKNKGHHPKTMA